MAFQKIGSRFFLFVAVLSAGIVSQDAADAQKEDSAMGSNVLFKESFEKGHTHWKLTDYKAWELKFRDGNHTFGLNKRKSNYNPKVRSPHNIALLRGIKVADFELTFKVRHLLDTGNHRDCCVFFNYQDPQNFYYVHLGAKPDPHSGQIMIVKQAPRKALTTNKNLTPWTDGWHTIRVVRNSKSGQIDIYFDDMKKKHMSVQDKTFGAGQIGLGSFDDMVEFDDVVLKKL